MTIQGQIDQLKKELSGITEQLGAEIEELKQKIKQDHIADTSKKVKPTRYYPNGAYMDEPEKGTLYYLVSDNYMWFTDIWDDEDKYNRLNRQVCFPTKEAAEKELNRQKLTAKMYRDMRDERINGEWVANWGDANEYKFSAVYSRQTVGVSTSWINLGTYDFYYKNYTFIEDLKRSFAWTEEELKIVWFRV